jgi:L-rhamnose isomerase
MADKWPEADTKGILEAYELARASYGPLGVDADAAIRRTLAVPISLHPWQGDDVAGFEVGSGAIAGGGLLATGNYPGRARGGDELRQDLDKVMSLCGGVHRVNLHAFYAETDGKCVERDMLEAAHFSRWVAWAKAKGIGLDFNPTYFSHPKAASGFTLSHADAEVRNFWIRHGIASRRIAEALAREVGSPCVNNCWIPDGAKDSTADRWGPRERLRAALDEVYAEDLGIDRRLCVDAVEGKLFGLGSEDYVVGSHEFYSGYALSKGLVLTLDMGHFHPTETIADKLSALLVFHKRLLLHVSRPVRWDSDHVAIFNDDLRAVFQELVRGGALDRAYVALDYFDPSINRLAAYVIGARATRKAILAALLEPGGTLKELEAAGKGAEKLALLEELKTMPFGAVWNRLCIDANVPPAGAWIGQVEAYERQVLSRRG